MRTARLIAACEIDAVDRDEALSLAPPLTPSQGWTLVSSSRPTVECVDGDNHTVAVTAYLTSDQADADVAGLDGWDTLQLDADEENDR
jgi:hypothetical protein